MMFLLDVFFYNSKKSHESELKIKHNGVCLQMHDVLSFQVYTPALLGKKIDSTNAMV